MTKPPVRINWVPVRIKYDEHRWLQSEVNPYMESIVVKDGFVVLTVEELKDLLASVWVDGKED
jgi:hypothetical protein